MVLVEKGRIALCRYCGELDGREDLGREVRLQRWRVWRYIFNGARGIGRRGID